ncbi:hypothetical protein DAPPUDRAFT_107009 [Daphnia pulex]|uniref:Uncharacterized protein n=1 Tax=Daphnia pulex TaxID=6669 RepID=E9GVN6_DAPPU|nr:hypothetical protein DAPPUDRAFT_107009 [Daphnia pulex]|eukprot:EFX76444.1 hypothetical protein DAPPUDRAFT_107009 [Daphnia pulex]
MAIQRDGLILGGRRNDRYKRKISYIKKIVARPYMTFAWLEPIASLADVQRTTTLTSTSTLKSTVTVTSKFVCAKLVNVTGLCRRRRGLLIDEPVILSFDDQLDEFIDDAFTRVLHPGQFVATRTLGAEVTPLVVLPDGIEEHPDIFHRRPNSNSTETMDVIESSIKMNDSQRRMLGDDDPQSRIYFAQLAAFANSIFDAIRPSTVTLTTTITVTRKTRRL